MITYNRMAVGDFITANAMVIMATYGISYAFREMPNFFKARAAYRRITTIIDRQPKIRFTGGRRLKRIQGHVEFHRVTFKYETRDTAVLHHLSLVVEAGSTVAFVGGSGSGKTTIFTLLEHFYEVTDGRVLIDGMDVNELDIAWLHRHMAIVSQEPVLFSMSIAENISYGMDGVTQEQIEAAANAANAHEFISKMPQGYNTQVGERGVQLSGGQKQRVAIARAMLVDPRILLLDEATSALDTESERLVQEALDRLMVGRTSLVIAHRLSTVRHASRIFVIQDGQVVGCGTHESLLETNDVYRTLASRQFADKPIAQAA